jgi:5'(3')-deoxyribonucleotidase
MMRKTYPITTDFLYIRNWIKQYFKFKKKENIVIKYRNDSHDAYTLVDDLTKGLDYYGIKTGSQIAIEEIGLEEED